MSFKISDETGFVSVDGIMDLPVITISAKDSSLGFYVRAGSILWKRDSDFSTAEIEVDEKRIAKENMLGDGITVGTEITISASFKTGGSEVLFSGYIMSQSLRGSGGNSDSKEESVVFKCVDYKYDLYRETIIGQIGIQAADDGYEAKTGGIYGSGTGWFSGLDCVFNDRTFAKNAESTWSRLKTTTRHGNARKEGTLAAAGSFEVVFDGDYFALNIVKDGEVPVGGRNVAWSAWDMLKYVMAYCYSPPYSFADVVADAGTGELGFADPEPIFVEGKRIILDIANGMDKCFPENVDVQGLRATDAITKICSSCGYHWTLEPTSKASILKVWRTGTSLSSKKLFMGTGGTGMPTGLYNTLIAGTNEFPLVNTEKWNIDDIDINIDYTQVIGCLIGTTQNIRVQDVFGLRKGWTNDIWFDLVKKAAIAKTKTQTGALDLEAHEVPLEASADTSKTIRYTIEIINGNQIKLHLSNNADDESLKAVSQDALSSIFRRWITDETGMIPGPDDSKRRPHNFIVNGLIKTNGSTYMVKPRPFLSKNLATAKTGDSTPPRTFMPKVSHGQTAEIVATDPVTTKLGFQESLDRSSITKKVAGKEFYPFGSKKGNVRILDDSSGIFIEGGDLKLQNMTIDPVTNKIYILSPIVLGAVEHDQTGLIVDRSLAVIGKSGSMKAGRRWIDGKQYRIERVQAIETTGYSSPQQIDAGADPKISTSTSHLASYSTNEKAKMAADILAMKEYYNAPVISMRARVPTITTAYKIGTSITGIEGRIDLAPDESGFCCIVGINFDLKSMNTIISVESEAMDPKFGIASGA